MSNEKETALSPEVQFGEEQLKKDLAKFDIKEAILKQAKEHLEFKITDPTDNTVYNKTDKTRKKLKRLRLDLKKKAMELKRPAIDYQSAINDEMNRIIDILKPAEKHLESEIKRVDRQREKIKEAEQAKRVKQLVDAGFRFDGTFYVAGQVMISPNKITDFSEDELSQHIESGREELARIKAEEEERAAREAEEKARREEEEKQREKERKEAEAEKKRLEKKREEIRKEREEIEAEKRRLAAEKEKEEAQRKKSNPTAPPAKPAPDKKKTTGGHQPTQKTHKPEPPKSGSGLKSGMPERNRKNEDDYDRGFNDCRERVLETIKAGHLPDGGKLSRRGLFEFVSNIEPDKTPF